MVEPKKGTPLNAGSRSLRITTKLNAYLVEFWHYIA